MRLLAPAGYQSLCCLRLRGLLVVPSSARSSRVGLGDVSLSRSGSRRRRVQRFGRVAPCLLDTARLCRAGRHHRLVRLGVHDFLPARRYAPRRILPSTTSRPTATATPCVNLRLEGPGRLHRLFRARPLRIRALLPQPPPRARARPTFVQTRPPALLRLDAARRRLLRGLRRARHGDVVLRALGALRWGGRRPRRHGCEPRGVRVLVAHRRRRPPAASPPSAGASAVFARPSALGALRLLLFLRRRLRPLPPSPLLASSPRAPRRLARPSRPRPAPGSAPAAESPNELASRDLLRPRALIPADIERHGCQKHPHDILQRRRRSTSADGATPAAPSRRRCHAASSRISCFAF